MTRELSKLQNERSEISDAERENNATAEQDARKLVLDQEIEEIRERQARLNRERSVATRLVDAVQVLNTKGHGRSWSARKKRLFLLVYPEFTLFVPWISQKTVFLKRVLDLEFARSEKSRGELVEDLIMLGV